MKKSVKKSVKNKPVADAEGMLTRTTHLEADYPLDKEEIKICQKYIKLFATRTKTIRPKHTSYVYKHSVERWLHQDGDFRHISNGAFIEAARRLGYEVKSSYRGSENAHFNMSIKAKDFEQKRTEES